MARVNQTSKAIKRGDIWTTDLRPGKGWEITKIRPALIVSSNAINKIAPTIVVIPISTQIPPVLGADRILVFGKETGLTKDSVVLCGQIRAIDKTRLKKKIGTIPKIKLAEVEEALRLVLDLDAKN